MMDSTKEGKTRLIESSSDSDSETQEMNRDKEAHNVEAALSSSGHRSKSRQTLYYHRITQNREKRSYKPYKQQDQPSRQLRHYYKNKALNTSETSSRVTASHTDVENEDLTSDNESEFIASEELLPQSDDTDFSDSETTETSESSTEDSVDDELEGNENIADVEQEKDEDLLHMPQQVPLYEGSVISQVFACVLVVSFVLRHNLSKAAWADLIRLLSVFVGRQYKGVFQSVYKMKLYLKDYFGTTDPVKVLYCSNCFSQVFDKQCPNQECQGRPLSGFLDLNLEERLKELFRDAEFCKLLKRGKEKIKDTAKRTIYDIYHGLDYKNFLYPGGFLTQEFNISFTINTDGVNKYSSSSAGHLWPVYVMINELPKEYRLMVKANHRES